MDARDAKVTEEVEKLAVPVVESQGITLVDVVYRREPSGRTLRLIVDRAGGVSLEECASISTELADLLDVKSQIHGPYNMEVSSPGLDFRLTKPGHFRHFEGRRVALWTRSPVDGKRYFEGVLKSFSEGKVITVAVGEEVVDVFFDNVAKARLND